MIRKGRGAATVYYPSGFNGGGDPDLATVRMKPDGTIDVSNATCDLGQGFKNVAVQIAAEVLGVDADIIKLDNSNSDTSAFSMDTAGSRSTVISGNAVKAAAEDLVAQIKEFAAEQFGVAADEMDFKDGCVFVAADPEKCMSLADVSGAATYGGTLLMGKGGFFPGSSLPRDPETGAQHGSDLMSYGSQIVDVEVDDETGVVTVKNMYVCYDMGTVINPMQAEGQAIGGDVMGIGMALFEDLAPCWPETMRPYTVDFTDYIIPTFNDTPDVDAVSFFENPDPIGPFGAKGCGEMVNNTQPPAIVNAIYDAVGVWVDQIPASPERVLRLIREKQAAEAE